MLSAASVCLFVNPITSERVGLNIGSWNLWVGAFNKILGRLQIWGHSPLGAHPQNVAFGYDVGKISASCLVVLYMYFQFDLQDEFLIRNIRAVFFSPGASRDDVKADMRPRAVKIEVRRAEGQGHQTSGGQQVWTAWRYYSDDCALDFPDVTEQVLANSGVGLYPSESATTVVCVRKYFAGDTATQTRLGYGLHEVFLSCGSPVAAALCI